MRGYVSFYESYLSTELPDSVLLTLSMIIKIAKINRLEPGICEKRYSYIAKSLGISVPTVKRCVQKLLSEGYIVILNREETGVIKRINLTKKTMSIIDNSSHSIPYFSDLVFKDIRSGLIYGIIWLALQAKHNHKKSIVLNTQLMKNIERRLGVSAKNRSRLLEKIDGLIGNGLIIQDNFELSLPPDGEVIDSISVGF